MYNQIELSRMNVVKGMEAVLLLELVRTVRMSFLSFSRDPESQLLWENQVVYFKKLVHFYMLDLDIKEFKDLRLPSEKKGKVKQPKTRSKKQPIKPRFRSGGKQLQLFFIKTSKQLALGALLIVEKGVKGAESILFKETKEFENRFR
ncbi:MAG: hypothetical protein KJP21_08850 [Bacteroidia bacterium]|nr:hypothetical protein [Bacteroidia bacterium]NNJ55654.1 hypothetical protein [Bacteroidia bacterium]